MSIFPTPSKTRELLTASRTYNVNVFTGNDSNDGISAPFRTIQKALTIVQALDFGAFDVTIQIADGPYNNNGMIITGWLGTGSLFIVGNLSVPDNVFISVTSIDAISIIGTIPSTLHLNGLRVKTAISGSGISHVGQGTVKFGNMVFDDCASFHISAGSPGAVIICEGNYTIRGSAVVHFLANVGGVITVQGLTTTLILTPNFSAGFAYATRCGIIQGAAQTYSGLATGPRYYVDTNAIIYTGGGGPNYFPGNVPGTIATGGQYV